LKIHTILKSGESLPSKLILWKLLLYDLGSFLTTATPQIFYIRSNETAAKFERIFLSFDSFQDELPVITGRVILKTLHLLSGTLPIKCKTNIDGLNFIKNTSTVLNGLINKLGYTDLAQMETILRTIINNGMAIIESAFHNVDNIAEAYESDHNQSNRITSILDTYRESLSERQWMEVNSGWMAMYRPINKET